MLIEPGLEQGRLLKRYKRFFADIETADGSLVTAHCPNTGSMLNCLQEGAAAWFVRNDDPKRKLKATLEILQTPHGRLACVNTGRANALNRRGAAQWSDQ
jgi:sugar fermentation stimulation protein A